MQKSYPRLRKYGPIITGAAVSFFAASSPANAAVDWVAAATAVGTAVLTIFGILVIMAAGYKGWEASLDHRSIVPSLIGMVFGILFTFGGAYLLTQMGAGNVGGGILL